MMRGHNLRHNSICIAILFMLSTPVVQAQQPDLTEFSLEQLLDVKVISASKREQQLNEAPSAVQIITREEIQKHGWRTLSEALLVLPGIYITNDHAYDYIGARGFQSAGDYNTRFLLLIDGQRNNDNIYQQALPGNEGWLDMSLVDRIEYIPGPGSAIYGSNAMYGVINVITRKAEKDTVRSAGVYLSQDGTAGLTLGVSQIFKREEESATAMLIQYSGEAKDGRDRSYRDEAGNLMLADGSISADGVAQGLDKAANQRLFLRIDQGDLSIKLLSHERTTHPSSALYLSIFDDPAMKVVDGGSQLVVSYQNGLENGSSIYARVGYTDWYYKGVYGYFDSVVGYYQNYDDVRGKTLDGELRYQQQIGAHQLLTGVEFSKDILAKQENTYSVDPALLGTMDVRVNTQLLRSALFVQDEYRLDDAWIMNLGARLDSSSASNSTLSPRLGVVWQAAPNWTVKMLSGRAYRSPNNYEKDYGNGTAYLSNPALQAETIKTTEGVVEWNNSTDTRWMFSLYQNRMNNLIKQVDQGGGLQFQNGGWVQVQGIELGVERKTESGLKLRSSMAVNRAENAAGSSQENSPDWIGKASASLPVLAGAAYLAGEMQVVGARNYTWNAASYSVPNEILAHATFTVPNLWIKGMQAQVRVANLFNNSYVHPASEEMLTPTVPQDGRTTSVNLSYAY